MNEDSKNRLGGILLLITSIIVGWWGIWQPYQEALQKAPVVKYYLKVFALVPGAAVFGAFLLIFGNKLPYRDVEKKSLTPTGWLLMIVTASVAFASFFWLKGQFEALGYRSY